MADTLDILSLNEGKTAINLDTSVTTHDTELAQFITGISRRIDDACGPVVVRTIADEIQYPGGSYSFRADHTPVSSVTTLTEYVSGTGTVLTAEDFDTVGTYRIVGTGHDVVIERRSGWLAYPYKGLVKVTYVAGRYATTAAVDAKFKLAAASILRRLWSREASAWSRGGDVFGVEPQIGFFRALDPMIDEFLSDELRPQVIE